MTTVYHRPHHQKILKALCAFNEDLLVQAKCFFAGGTAIAMSLGEYRTSVDIDFLCADAQGYRFLRNAVGGNSLGPLLKEDADGIALAREIRTDQSKILTVLDVDGVKIKVEFVREGRVSLRGGFDSRFPVAVLESADLYTQKLLANADRGLDTSYNSRDIIDLAMMIRSWGPIPSSAWFKAYEPYGDVLYSRFQQAVGMVGDSAYLRQCLLSMEMDLSHAEPIGSVLRSASARLPRNVADQKEFDRRWRQAHALAAMPGPAAVLFDHLKAAIAASSAEQADWATAEVEAACECVFELGFSVHETIEAIVRHSPGCASVERQKAVAKHLERSLPELHAAWLDRRDERLRSGQTPSA